MSHFVFAVMLSIVLSVALGLLGDRGKRERVYAMAYSLVCCMASILAGGWIMYWVHG